MRCHTYTRSLQISIDLDLWELAYGPEPLTDIQAQTNSTIDAALTGPWFTEKDITTTAANNQLARTETNG